MISTSTLTYYWDVEPNLHFFKLYQKALEEIDLIHKHLEKTEESEVLLKEALTKIRALMRKMYGNNNQLVEKNFYYFSNYIQTIILFIEGKKVLIEMNKSWTENKIYPKMFEFFNLKLDCLNSNCPYELMKPLKCSINQNTTLEMEILIIKIKPNKIIKAKTFEFIRKTNNTTCTLNYDGNEHFIQINDTCVISV